MDKTVGIQIIVPDRLVHGKTIGKEQQKPCKIFAGYLVGTFGNFFCDQGGEALVAPDQMRPYFLVADHGIIKKRKTEFNPGHITFQNIFYQTVERSVLVCIFGPLTKFLPLFIQVFICDGKKDFVFIFKMIIESSLGNACLGCQLGKRNL